MSAEGVRIAEQPSQAECRTIGATIRIPHYGDENDPKIKFGDVCFVDDEYWSQFAGVRFRFVATAHNLDSGITWVELNGGPPGKQWTRAFPATSVRIPVKKK